ncbi:MAG: hypothetical protein AB7T10_08440 [bacterium]
MASLGEAKEKARKAQNEGQYEKAIKIYMQILAALKNNPDPSFYNTIGDIYLNNLKKNAEAVENYRAALTIYVNQSWHSNAIVMAKKIIKVDPSLLEMYETVADLYKKMGSLGEALNSYILLAEKSLQSNNKALAIEAFKKTLELMPDKVEIKDKLVELYMQEGNFEFALEYLRDIESYHMKRGDLPNATATRVKISQLESKMGKPPKEEKRAVPVENVKVEPPHPIAEESLDIDIDDLTAGLSKQLDETFANTQEKEEISAPAQESNQQSNSPESELDGLFKEDASSYGSFVELGKLQEDIDIGGAVQSYYQGADGYYEANDLINALNVYKRIFEIKSDEDKAVKRIIEIASKAQMYREALLPYVHLAKEAMGKSPTDALSYINNALSIDPTFQPAVQLKAALDAKLKPQSPFTEPPRQQVQPQQTNAQPQQQYQQPQPKMEPIKQTPPPVQPTLQQPTQQNADRFFSQPAQATPQENPLDDFVKDILGEMSDLDFLKESEHVTAKDIIQGKNEGNKPKFKIEDNKPQQQDSSVWSLQELLDELKEGLDQNIEESDVSSHYDLGVSFKEMGLYDMAIEEFQKSVKHKDYEIKSLEMLGICFLEKQEYDLAESSLQKALSNKTGGNETAFIGIKYTLGKLYEAKKMTKEALKIYNEIYTVDSKFEDVEKRMNAIKSAPKEIEKRPQIQQPQQKTPEKQSDFIDFSSILKDEISSDFSIDDIDLDNFTVELTDEEKENLAKKNNKVSYM